MMETENLPVPTTTQPPITPLRLPALAEGWAGLRHFAHQPALRRAIPVLGLLGAAALTALAWWMLQSPAHSPLFNGLTDADKSAVVEALQGAGIPYELDPATGAIEVNDDTLHRARILLAGQGLPKAAPGGDALLATLPLGSSRAVEGETLRSAREADLARTIEAIDAVKSARLHLAIPEPSPFVRDQAVPAASVMLTLQPGRTLSEAQIRAVRHLVASSVPGLAPPQVSLVDQSGALLSQSDTADNPAFELQIKMEERYRQALAALLGPMVGRENYTAEVHVDIDRSESQSTRETYPKDDRALRQEEGNRSTNATMPAAIGIPGAMSNQPPQATTIAKMPGGTSAQPPLSAAADSQAVETYNRTFDVGREISVTHQPQGRIARLTVAVALREPAGSKPRTTRDMITIETLVKGAIGFDARRGDIVAISSRPFVTTEDKTAPFWTAPWFLPAVRQGMALLVALLLFFIIGRPLMKSVRRLPQENMLEQQLLAATSDGAHATGATSPRDAVTIEMIESTPGYEQRAELVRRFVRQNPERAALVVRKLVAGGRHG